jgi:hypothetical protein
MRDLEAAIHPTGVLPSSQERSYTVFTDMMRTDTTRTELRSSRASVLGLIRSAIAILGFGSCLLVVPGRASAENARLEKLNGSPARSRIAASIEAAKRLMASQASSKSDANSKAGANVKGARLERRAGDGGAAGVQSCLGCVSTPIECGDTVTGALETGECLLQDDSFFDLYSFEIVERSGVDITLGSPTFDTYLIILGPDCSLIGENDDCGDATDSCLIGGVLDPGTYFVVANSFDPGDTGAYTLSVTCGEPPPSVCESCPTAIIECGATQGGSLDAGECLLNDGSLFDLYSFELTAETAVDIDFTSAEIDTFLFLVDENCNVIATNDDCSEGTLSSCLEAVLLPPGAYFIVANSFEPGVSGPYALEFSCGGSGANICEDCTIVDVACGTTQSAALESTDCTLDDGSFVDLYRLVLDAAETVTIELDSESFDTFLLVFDETCGFNVSNDDCDDGTLSSCIVVELPAGTHFIAANSVATDKTGGYELRVTCSGGNGGARLPGDCNNDGNIDISDAVCVFGFLFLGNPDRLSCGTGLSNDPANIALVDWNADENIDLSDGIGVLTFLFAAGAEHPLGLVCVAIEGCDPGPCP